MNAHELSQIVSHRTFNSKYATEETINEAFAVIANALRNGDKVSIPGFGCFETKDRAPRTGRNPHTNMPVPIPAKRVPAFKPFLQLKRLVES